MLRRRPQRATTATEWLQQAARKIHLVGALLLLLVLLLVVVPGARAATHDPATGKIMNTVPHCINAVNEISKNGYGATPSSCMGCDPTLPTCYFNCKPLVTRLYEWCDSVCLPDGFYFDPKKTMKGCWKDNLKDLKISVERCGCNAAASLGSLRWRHVAVVASVAITVAAALWANI